MKRIALVLTVMLALSGCADIQSILGTGLTEDTMQAAKIAITGYVDVYQPAVLAYGSLPVCGTPGATVICKDPLVLSNLKAADKRTMTAINAAKTVLEGGAFDGGEVSTAQAEINATETAIGASGALTISHGAP